MTKTEGYENFRAQNPLFSNSRKKERKRDSDRNVSNVLETRCRELDAGCKEGKLGPRGIEPRISCMSSRRLNHFRLAHNIEFWAAVFQKAEVDYGP